MPRWALQWRGSDNLGESELRGNGPEGVLDYTLFNISALSDSLFFAEAVGCWDEPIRWEDRSTTVHVTREVEAGLPRPLPLQRINSTHNPLRSCLGIHLHQRWPPTCWRVSSDGLFVVTGSIILELLVCAWKLHCWSFMLCLLPTNTLSYIISSLLNF